jgi:predicted NAD-dependent protein-ADP-ribosyltransferase YbiA (DUF1768 family)
VLLRYLLLSSLAISAAHPQPPPPYPAHWWAAVPEANRPAWEILPQSAKPPEVILSKRHELGILSNFAATPFTYRGVHYASVEGFWQMMLYPEGPNDERSRIPGVTWPHTRTEVGQMTAFEAKAAGDFAFAVLQKAGIRWVSFEGKRFPYWSLRKGQHYRLILEAMRAKLAQNQLVKETLLATGDLVLRPDHFQEPNAPPEWRYFEIWMRLRSGLRRQPKAN